MTLNKTKITTGSYVALLFDRAEGYSKTERTELSLTYAVGAIASARSLVGLHISEARPCCTSFVPDP